VSGQYAVFLLAFTASATAPGPDIAALLSRSLSRGMLASIPLGVGMVLGKLLMLTAAVVGLTVLVRALGPMFVVLRFCGAAYLVFLGVRKWRNAGRLLATAEQGRRFGALVDVGLGSVITLSNPIAIVFYMAALPGVVDVSGLTFGGYVVLCSIIVGVMAVVVLGYGALAEIARRLFATPAAKMRVDRTSGALMVLAGALIAAR
jgi:threonine/homoserine/homoserine lactone efflux protein